MAQNQVFRGTARAIHTSQEGRHYVYHRTAVVTVLPNGDIRLDTGGYRTRTTMLAMNQASNQDRLGFKVYQRAFCWYVLWKRVELAYDDRTILLCSFKDIVS